MARAPKSSKPKPKRRRPLALRIKPRDWMRITREGWLFIAICFAVGLAAIRSGNNLLYLILGMMLGLIVASGILSELSLRGLSFERTPPPALHAAKPFLMGISVTNTKRHIASFSIEVEDIQGDRVLDKRCYFLKIPAGRTQSTAYRHAFPRRGVYAFSGFKISTKFPFALLRKSRVVELETEVEVLPAVYPVSLPVLPAPGATGDRHRPLRGRGGDFYGVRDFRPGDDPRDVHWKASAHRGRLVLRERQAETAQEYVILPDHRLALPEGASLLASAERVERAITMAASLATALLDRGYRVGLRTLAESLPPERGPAQQARILRILARLPYADADAPLPETPRGPLALRVALGGGVTLEGTGPTPAPLGIALPLPPTTPANAAGGWA